MAKKVSNEIEQIIIDNYNNGKSPYWMVKNVEELKDKKPNVIYGIMKRLGITTNRTITLTDSQRLSRRKYNVDDNYFETIDSDDKAYFLGFIYADGYITKDSDKIGITIAKKDVDLLEKFKIFSKAESPINSYMQTGGYNVGEYYSRLLITSKKMKSDLLKHGVLISKTEKIKFPTTIDEKFYYSFIRGYFDGDGCITTGGNLKNGAKVFNVKIVGTRSFLESISEILGVSVKLIKRHKDSDVDNYTITICGNVQLKNILGKLYNGSTIHLERKYNKYLELINQ